MSLTKINFEDFLSEKSVRTLEGVTSDSRQVKDGFLFAALAGTKANGSAYIGDALSHGATHVLVDEAVDLEGYESHDAVFITSKNPKQDFAQLVAEFYQLQPENIVAVTGTSGKTSTVSFVQQLWHLSGITKCASLGTLGVRGPGLMKYGRLTTPDSETLHAELADLAAVGINHLAMEASSHGLDQFRLDAVKVKAAAFTNLSRDHLDYHKDMESYFQAKARLFKNLMMDGSTAILNADDAYFEPLVKICQEKKHKILSFGFGGETIKILSLKPKPTGQDLSFSLDGKEYNVTLPLVGEFQAFNALCALLLVLALDNRPDHYIPHLENLRGVSGRLQLIPGHKRGAVYVDYAHKPAALEAILKTLRPHTDNKLICLFGCGGNRDPGKRGMMGEIASRLADTVIVTDDNPRYEDAATIRQQILEQAPDSIEIADRKEAIEKGVAMTGAGDVLVIAGKGHEPGQIIGENVLPFNDIDEAAKAIEGDQQ